MSVQEHSRLPNFYAKDLKERTSIVAQRVGWSSEECLAYDPHGGLTKEDADHMVENAIGVFGMPMAVAANFVVDGEPVLVPMAVEEPSVVAAASHMGKIVAQNGGFTTSVDAPMMIGQVQLFGMSDVEASIGDLELQRQSLILEVNQVLASLVKRGGGCKDICFKVLPPRAADENGVFLVVEFFIDCRDAMGANLVNTALESVSLKVAKVAKASYAFRILSNLCDRRLARASCELDFRTLSTDDASDNGAKVAKAICMGYEFAMRDTYRAATHNKGIMNGVDAVAIATGNDWRAIEAGAHAYAARSGQYQSLSHYKMDEKKGKLLCAIELPLSVGVVGGATKVHKTVAANLKMLGQFGKSSQSLARLMASVGLAQNLGAMRALASEGIQKGHMALHFRKRESHANCL